MKKLLSDAEGYYNTGRYDLAFKKYEQVLGLDPYNVAARRGEERINLSKTHYGEEAYNESRSQKLWQVQKGWEEPVRQYGQTVEPISDAFARDAGGTARITNKLNSIIIPKIEFRDASIREAIDFLRQQAAANDPTAEGKQGVDIVLRTASLGRAELPAPLPESAPPLPGTIDRGGRRAHPGAGAGRPFHFALRRADHAHAKPDPVRRSAALYRESGGIEGQGGALCRLDHSDQRAE